MNEVPMSLACPKKGRKIISFYFFILPFNSLWTSDQWSSTNFSQIRKKRVSCWLGREIEEKTRNDGTEADRAFNLRNLVAGLENHFNAAQLIVSNLINGLREHSENENNEKTERKSKLNNRKFENYLSLFYWRDRKV